MNRVFVYKDERIDGPAVMKDALKIPENYRGLLGAY